MSKHIGKVLTSERNEQSPQANIDASVGGVEVAVFDPKDDGQYAQLVSYQPDDARTFAALLVRAADAVERMRARSHPQEYLANRLKSAEEALLKDRGMKAEFAESTRRHFETFTDKPKGGT